MLRLKAVLAYRAFVDDQILVAGGMIQEAIEGWQQAMLKIDWMKYPMRFLDGKGDMMALHALSCLAGRIGMSPKWITEHDDFIYSNNDPWLKCIRHVGFSASARIIETRTIG